MKNKKLLIVLMIITSSIIIGCTNKISSEEKVIDSVVIDEDTKETASSNNKINISKIIRTENISGRHVSILDANEKLIEIQYNQEYGDSQGTINQTQFPKMYITSLSIGTITDEIKENRNVINWEYKDIDGQLLIDYIGGGSNFKILKENRVYTLDNNYNLKEINAYKKLIDETKGDLVRFEASYNGNLDIYYIDNNNKLGVVDIVNDKYYEIYKDKLGNIDNKRLNILTAEDNKIYVSIVDVANEATSTIGYIENNKLITFFDEKSAIRVRVTGDVIYSNNNMLFSGYVEEDYGIWNYNIDTKKLEKQLELKYDYSYFKISKDKNFIIISNMDHILTQNYDVRLARIDENLKISNMQDLTNSILPNISYDKWLNVIGWSNNGNKFFVNCVDSKKVDSGLKVDDIYYEIYEVK